MKKSILIPVLAIVLCAGLLFGVAAVTSGMYLENAQSQHLKDLQTLLPGAESFVVEPYSGEDANIRSVHKGENGYVLLLEFGPHPFSYTFVTSPDMLNWTFMPDECIFGKDRYVGGPWMRYSRGWYYVIAVEELPASRYTNYIYRTKNFKDWYSGYYNPLFMPSDDDRIISPYAFDLNDELKEQIRTGFISSNSDVDMCDWNSKTLFTYNAGNQLGFYFLAEAEYDGTVADFLKSYFEGL